MDNAQYQPEAQNPSEGSSDRMDRIRERAYERWISEGQPEGKDLEHWMGAERDIAGEAPQAGTELDENLSVLGKPGAGAQ